MYLEHFGLREAPFRITPHTEFFFAGGNRGATLEALIYAATHDEGIIKVSGEVGTGKTMLCRMLLERLPDNVETVYLANPSLSRDEILHSIADELGMPLQENRPHLLLRALQERLVEIYASGRQVVALIDEAHAMPAESLEEIRLLSNLESSRHKLLHIVLFGQPELDERLAQNHMRQLKERITHNFALEPLKRNDIASYLMFRMRAAGYRGPDPFTPAAIRTIAEASEGLTRRINILADKALLAAFSQGAHLIGQNEAKAAVRDAQFNPMNGRFGTNVRFWAVGMSLAIAASVIVLFFAVPSLSSYLRNLQAPPVAYASAQSPAVDLPASVETAPPQVSTPLATASAFASDPVVDTPAPVSGAIPGPEKSGLGPLTEARLAASAGWLAQASDKHYFIQLLNVDVQAAVLIEDFLTLHADSFDSAQLRVYRSSLSGRDRVGLIYGEYASRGEAQAAIARMPAAVQAANPYIRSVKKLR